mmetsp:Transcript_85210/g.237891  ORF Transcript_85210/g.237891 Transcript_85210/m.237891 type:complete len:232 (+) Transcript_85210:52-747(+)
MGGGLSQACCDLERTPTLSSGGAETQEGLQDATMSAHAATRSRRAREVDEASEGEAREELAEDEVAVVLPPKGFKVETEAAVASRWGGLESSTSCEEDATRQSTEKTVEKEEELVAAATSMSQENVATQRTAETSVGDNTDAEAEDAKSPTAEADRTWTADSANVSQVSTPKHKHPLEFVTHCKKSGILLSRVHWRCDGCGTRNRTRPGIQRYRCTRGCNFDLCDSCINAN